MSLIIVIDACLLRECNWKICTSLQEEIAERKNGLHPLTRPFAHRRGDAPDQDVLELWKSLFENDTGEPTYQTSDPIITGVTIQSQANTLIPSSAASESVNETAGDPPTSPRSRKVDSEMQRAFMAFNNLRSRQVNLVEKLDVNTQAIEKLSDRLESLTRALTRLRDD